MISTLLLAALAALAPPAATTPACAARPSHVPAGKIVHAASVRTCARPARAADRVPIYPHQRAYRAKI